jgi:phosphatidylglycerophosphatase GEP4
VVIVDLTLSLHLDMSYINYAALKKQANIQAIGFDKDNCLTAPYVSNIHPPFEVCINRAREAIVLPTYIHVNRMLGKNVKRHLVKTR